MSRRTLGIVLAVLGAATVFVAAAGLRGRASLHNLRIVTADVTFGTVARRVMVTGTLQPPRTVAVGSQVSGTIASISADFNDRVRAGEVLARLDRAAFEARLAEAEAKVQQARGEHARRQVALDEARAALARADRLATDHLLAGAELEAARTTAEQAIADLKAADAAVAAAEAEATEARVRLDRTTIRSPIEGLVIARHVDVGQTIAASVDTPVLFTVADLRRMQVLAEVSEGDVGGVQPGARVAFQIESLGEQHFEGTVSTVRLQPVLEQAIATSGSAPGAPAAAGTAGTGNTPQNPAAGTGAGANAPSVSPTQPAGGTATQPSSTRPSSQPGVVTYTVIIDVPNVDDRLRPGSTAIIMLDGPQRHDVIRIPNNALTFHPSAAAFAAADQDPPTLDRSNRPGGQSATATRRAFVWKFEHQRFVPIPVETGLADDLSTELVAGPIRPGDVLVTAALPHGRRERP